MRTSGTWDIFSCYACYFGTFFVNFDFLVSELIFDELYLLKYIRGEVMIMIFGEVYIYTINYVIWNHDIFYIIYEQLFCLIYVKNAFLSLKISKKWLVEISIIITYDFIRGPRTFYAGFGMIYPSNV